MNVIAICRWNAKVDQVVLSESGSKLAIGGCVGSSDVAECCAVCMVPGSGTAGIYSVGGVIRIRQ